MYPALEAKVKNVTLIYSVEHEDEEHLLEELTHLLALAIGQSGPMRSSTLKQFNRKAEAVHTTLAKHLSKEEKQLVPLLLAHFDHEEQSELVAQFLCCIPLAAVRPVLSWLKAMVPLTEQTALQQSVEAAVTDDSLKELLVSWLQPESSEVFTSDDKEEAFSCCSNPSACSRLHVKIDVEDLDVQAQSFKERPPLREILYFHQAIRSALSTFAYEANSLKELQGAVTGAQLSALVERHRFMRAVCQFHSISEDEIVFPALKRIDASKSTCEDDHNEEALQFEKLGRLLGDVRALARRGAKQVAELVEDLADVAHKLSRAMGRHMTREETEVFPVLMKTLCHAEQRHMIWRILCAMPLRLLERVMPWVASKLRSEEVHDWLVNIKSAAPREEAPLLALLVQWTLRGQKGVKSRSSSRSRTDDPSQFSNQTCGPFNHLHDESVGPQQAEPPLKRIRVVPDEGGVGSGGLECMETDGCGTPMLHHQHGVSTAVPIDHIFQFHRALKRELRELETAAIALQADADESTSWGHDTMIAALDARFQFLRGIYRAHSKAEDEIVFPALEAKDFLSNVSHAYTLDHRQEELLFEGVEVVVHELRSLTTGVKDVVILRRHATRLARMCSAVRAALETHVRAEEKELWPLFAEHFSIEEQEKLVGLIIGQTGGEVLRSMLSWVREVLTKEEREAMMVSIKSATKATAFEQWLGAALGDDVGACSHHSQGYGGEGEGEPILVDQAAVLAEVAHYLAKHGSAGMGPSDPTSLAADSSQFKPGWEEIFRMNQKQLEAAVRRVSADPSLEPQRKAYLIQNIMASKYIVAQQKRMASSHASSAVATPTGHHHWGAGVQDMRRTDGTLSIPEHSTMHTYPDTHTQSGTATTLGNNKHSTSFGCRHYKRNCMLVAPCCGTTTVCRLCHDEKTHDGHTMDRYAVSEMLCMKCGERQPVAQDCAYCLTSMARYYCKICHLFDDEPGRDIYHCPFCNFCRQGKGLGVDSFHCMSCNACMSLELFNKHKCKEQSLGGDCPVCSEGLFDSKFPIKELPCGHFMHSHCFAAYTRYSYTCPVCSKSLGDMSVYWRMIDSLLAGEAPLPSGYAERKQPILCNDCGATGEAPFHFVYHKCPASCGSYNTRVM